MSTVLADGLTTTVPVTAEHIARGVARTCDECPIALAILAAIPALDRVTVTAAAATTCVGDDWYSANLPGGASGFIARYDHSTPVEPFTFDLTWRAW